MGPKGKESLQSFGRSRFPPLKQRAVGKPRKASREASVSNATLGRLERSPSKGRSWHVSNRKGGSTSSSFDVYDWERRDELLRLQQEEEKLKEQWLNQSAVDTDADVAGESSHRTPSPLLDDDERMDTSGEPDGGYSPGSPMEGLQQESAADPLSDAVRLDDTPTSIPSAPPTKRKQASGPSEGQQTEYNAWKLLLPSLVGPYLHFLKVEKEEVSPSMLGVRLLESECDGGCDTKQETRVLCLFIECMWSVN
jgi:hypothetical protein